MFLRELSKTEQKAFVSLCYQAAQANEVVLSEEVDMIRAYCKEMEIEFISEENSMKPEEAIDVFKNASDRIKKVVVFELLGVMLSDGEYDKQEKDFITKVGAELGLSEFDIMTITNLIMDYWDLVEKISKTLG